MTERKLKRLFFSRKTTDDNSNEKRTLVVNVARCPQNHPCPSIRVCPTSALTQKGFRAPDVDQEKCVACGLEPKLRYGDTAGAIIEVHHLEALSLQAEPRPYDPAVDLVPLCPNCHRAVHTRRPVPLPIDELKSMVEAQHG